MGSCGSRWDSASNGESESVSPREKRLYIDPYIIPTSIDDSILLKDTSHSYLTPTPYPAPVRSPHDRDAIPSSRTFELKGSPPRPAQSPRALIIHCTTRTPSPLSPPATSTRPPSPRALRPGSSSPNSPVSLPSSNSAPSVALAPCPSPSPSPLPLSPTTSPIPNTRTRAKRNKIVEPIEFKETEDIKNGHVRLLSMPALPPPAYQHSIGQGVGRKDAGGGREWE